MKKIDQSGAVPLLILVAAAGLVGFLAIAATAGFSNNLLSSLFPKDSLYAATHSFADPFNGVPPAPQPFVNQPNSANWDIAIQSRDWNQWLQLTPVAAHHGPNCAAPIDGSGNLVTHSMGGSYEDAVFQCADHVMTSIRAGVGGAPDQHTVQPAGDDGYGLIYITPNQMVDFSTGEAVIKIDISTLRTSTRDWWDIWVTPWEDNLQLPFDAGDVDIQGVPRNAVHITQADANGNGSGFTPSVISNFNPTNDFRPFTSDWNWYTGYETFMTSSPKQRTTFELRLSKTHIKFGIPAGQVDVNGVPINNGQAFWWVDKDIAPLSWDKGIVQFGHHSYNPSKDCNTNNNGYRGVCTPNTWHWDNASISESIPFSIIKANRRYVSPSSEIGTDRTDAISFNQPAPANSFLRFAGIGTVEVSFNNGTTWQQATRQMDSFTAHNTHHAEHVSSYWMSIPTGTNSVKFRFSPDTWYQGPYIAKDFAIWSTTAAAASSPSPSPSPSAAPALPGDIDGNKKVDIFDYNFLLTDFGATSGAGLRSDIDHNNKVDIFDYNFLLTNFGKTTP